MVLVFACEDRAAAAVCDCDVACHRGGCCWERSGLIWWRVEEVRSGLGAWGLRLRLRLRLRFRGGVCGDEKVEHRCGSIRRLMMLC